MRAVILIVLICIIVFFVLAGGAKKKKKNTEINNSQTINEESYQRYAKFYEHAIPADILFEKKMNSIYQSVVNEKQRDIKKIA